MLEILSLWGVTQAVGFIFKPVLEELAKSTAKDWAKDIFKKSFANVLKLPKKEPLEIAAGKAIKEFLGLIQQELEDLDLEEDEIKKYVKPLNQYLSNNNVKETLGSAFKEDCKRIDTTLLAKTWNDLELELLPDDFNWEIVSKRYSRKLNPYGVNRMS